MKELLVQFAKTAALCSALGLAMLAVIEWAASSSSRRELALALGLVLSTGLAFLTVRSAIDGWRTGVLPGKTGSVTREAQPVLYWTLLALEAAASAGLAAVAIYCAARFAAG
jgi:hypothetical protein